MRVLTFLVLLSSLSTVEMFAQNSVDTGCKTYFGVVQFDPNAPGGLVARMSDSQSKWFAKEGPKKYPGLCSSLEKAQFLILWTVSKQTQVSMQTVERSAQVNTTTTGTESGRFSTYGTLSTWGRYSGTSSSSSTSTVRYKESVPVTVTSDYSSAYVIKPVGPTIWDDINSKTAQPLPIFSTEAERKKGLLWKAVNQEPTESVLEDALKFISAHGR